MDISKFIKRKRVVVVPAPEEGGAEFWVEISNEKMNLANRKRMDAAVEIQDWEDLHGVFVLLDLKWNLSRDGEVIEITKDLFTSEESPIVADIWYKINAALAEDAAVPEGESSDASTSASMEAALNARPGDLPTGTSPSSPPESSE